jgi:PAS domain S-box-containing protein
MEGNYVARWSRFFSVAVLLIALLGLAGWQFNIELLRRPLPGTMPMSPLTALMLILAICVLALFVRKERTVVQQRLAYILIAIMVFVSTYKIIQVVFGLDFVLDTFLYTDRVLAEKNENREGMPLVTAVNFLLIIIILLTVFSKKNRTVALAQCCALIVMLNALFFLLGYMYRVPEFYLSRYYYPMAALTSVSFLFLSVALLLAHADKGLMKQFTSPYAGSVIARVLIPLVIILPLLIGYIRLWAHWYNMLSTELGVTSIVLSFIIVFALLILFNTNSLNRKDLQQKMNANRLQYVNRELQASNHETAAANEELRAALEELTTTNEELITSNENLVELNDKLEHAKATIRDQAEEIIRQKDELLSEYRRNLDIIFSNTQEGILLLDANNTVVLFNKTFETFIGGAAGIKPKRGMRLTDVVVKERRDLALQLYIQALNGEAVVTEAYISTPEREVVHLLRYEPVRQFGKVTHVIIMSMDITEKKAREKIVQQSEANLRAIFNSTPDAYILLAKDYHIIAYNRAYEERMMYYFQREPEVGANIADYIQEERREPFMGMLERARQGELVQYEVQSTASGGTLYWVAVTITLVNDEAGQLIGYCINLRDTTAVKTAEIALRESEEKFRAVVEYSDDVFALVDLEGNIFYASPSFTRKLGYTWEEIREIKGHDFVHPDDFEQYAREWAVVMENPGKLVSITCRARHKDGGWIWMQGTSINLSHIPSVKGIVSTYRDIGSQKAYENKITSIAKELSVLIETSNVPIFGLDQNGYINEWNDVTAEVMQYSKADAYGKKWIDEFVEKPYRETVDHLLTRVLHGHSLTNFELPVITKNNESIILLLSASPRYDAQDQIRGIIIVAQNITELIDYRKGLEKMVQDRTRELNDALQKEKELADLKTKFVSMASHEFRTPLSTISLATGFIRRYKAKITPEDVDKKLDDIVRQVEHMNYLLEDVLTVGKAESGKVQVNVAPIEMPAFFEKIASEVYESTGRTHHIHMALGCDQKTIASDPRMMRIILVNLLTNAIKFSPGKNIVWVTISCATNTLQLKVKDEGLGIPDEDREKLFHSFHRASNAGAIQGTGLGLSIVRKTVDLLDGVIQVESKLNEGTTFTISIPIDGRQENTGS